MQEYSSSITNSEKQIKNSIIYLIPVITSSLIPFITLPIFTRILTIEDYGVFALAQIYAIFTSGICNFGLINVYNRNYFKYTDQKQKAKLLYSILIFVFTLTSILALLTYLFKSPLSELIIRNSKYSNLLFWAFCSSGAINLKTYYLSYFKNSENAGAFVWYTVIESLLNFIFSIILVAYLKVGVIGMVLGPFFAAIVIFLILTVKFSRFLQVAFNRSILKDCLKIGYPLTFKILFGVIGNQFDKYMIGLLVSVGSVGIYSIGQRVSSLIFTFMVTLSNVYQPQVFTRMFEMKQAGGPSIGQYLMPFAYISILSALSVSLFSEEMIYLLTPESYHSASEIIIVLSMFYGFLFLGMHPQLLYAKKTYISSLLAFSGLALNIVLNLCFITRWGSIGAAWATFFSGIVSGTLSFIISQKYYRIEWQYTNMAGIYAILFCSSITLFLLKYYAIGYAYRLIFKLIAFSIYLYLGKRIGILSMENIHIIRNMIVKSGRTSGVHKPSIGKEGNVTRDLS